jgi:cytoskeletal protein CcmA (bactofilin family)
MFSRTNPAAPSKSGKRSASFSVLGPDVVVTGDLSTAENLQVDGRIDGDVRCAELHQGADSTIAGNIVADEARLAGLIDGTVTAAFVMLDATARVTGEVTYTTLCIESGARVEGRFVYRAAAAAEEETGSGRASLDEIFPHAQAAE